MTTVFANKWKYETTVWIKALRAPFFTASIVPVILGSSIAIAYNDAFNLPYFILTLIGVVSLQAGGNMLNDYFDYKSGADIINQTPTPFSGGSRVLVDGLLKPQSILQAAILSITLGLGIGSFLAYKLGTVIILLGVLGVLCEVVYSAPPLKLVYRGLGEVVVGLAFGPLIVLGSYYVQTQTISKPPIVASLPISFLIVAVLYINEFPDYKADKEVGKNQLVVLLGQEKAIRGYGVITLSAYISIIIGVVSGLMPPLAIIGLLTYPQAKKAYKILKKHHRDIQNLIPANAMTIKIHIQTGLLLSFGYLASAYL